MKIFIVTLLLIAMSIFASAQSYIYAGDSGKRNVQKFDLEGNLIEIIDDDINTPRGIEVDFENKLIFFVNAFNDSSLRVFDETTKEIKRLVSGLSSPFTLALNIEDKVVYYSEIGDSRISKVNYDGTNNELVNGQIFGNSAIDFDPLEQKIYYSNDDGSSIYRMDTEGNSIELVVVNRDDIHDINLDVENKLIYFSELGSTNAISVIEYSGSNETRIVQDSRRPTHLNLDCESETMYYMTANDDVIRSINLSDSQEKKIDIGAVELGAIVLDRQYDCSPTSVDNPENNLLELQVYPNPSENEITISTPTVNIDLIIIYNQYGQLVIMKQNDYYSQEMEIDVQKLIAGTYFIRAILNNEEIETLKFIKAQGN